MVDMKNGREKNDSSSYSEASCFFFFFNPSIVKPTSTFTDYFFAKFLPTVPPIIDVVSSCSHHLMPDLSPDWFPSLGDRVFQNCLNLPCLFFFFFN